MIDLSPHEWATATWRPLPDVSGSPREFDPNEAAALIKRDVHYERDYLDWEWTREPFADPIGVEEATAWLRVAYRHGAGDPSAIGLWQACRAPIAPTDLIYYENGKLPPGCELAAMLAVTSVEHVLGRVLAGDWVAGVRASLLPRLGAADRARVEDFAREQGDLRLAAEIGLHEELEERVARGGVNAATALGLGSPDRVRAVFERDRLTLSPYQIPTWIAHTGLDALGTVADSILALDDARAQVHGFRILTRITVAAEAVFALTRCKPVAALARQWLLAHADETAAALEPLRDDRAAADLLRALGRTGNRAARALAGGDDEVDAPADVAAALKGAPRKNLAEWLEVPLLPPLRVEGGRLKLPDVERVLRLLAHERPLPGGIDGLDALTVAIVARWDEAGHPAAGRWVLAAAGNAGGVAAAAKLAGLARTWPSARAFHALKALRANGALMHLDALTRTARKPQVRERADEILDEIAAERGLTREQLGDRAVPDCGLDADGTRRLEIAGRAFTFAVGPQMKPMLRDEKGKLRATPPKPSEEWKALRKQVTDVAKLQAGRLEQAMVEQRGWSVDEFETLIVRHPLQRHLARLLVWRDDVRPFRVTDELDFADVDDEPVTLTGRVVIAHPVGLTEDERAHWGELFADYGLVPPFPQLSRPALDVEPAERDATDLARVHGRRLPAGTLLSTLERLGWLRGPAEDGGTISVLTRAHEGATAVVQFSPGIYAGYPDYDEPQTLEHCYATDGDYRKLPWSALGPIARSEILGDIEAVLGKAT